MVQGVSSVSTVETDRIEFFFSFFAHKRMNKEELSHVAVIFNDVQTSKRQSKRKRKRGGNKKKGY